MTMEELVSRERYPYEVARYLHISKFRMRKLMEHVTFVCQNDSEYAQRKLPPSVVIKIVNFYNSL